MSSSPTFLFTPGAWHQPSTFDLVRANLKLRGFESAAVTLASVDPKDPKNQGVAEDAAAIRSELTKLVDQGKEVIVVCHSYGGAPTASAVEGFDLKDRVAKGEKGGVLMVIYLASGAIPAGVAMVNVLPGGVGPDWWKVDGDVINPADEAVKIFYADVEKDLAAKAIADLRPFSLRAVQDKNTFEPWNNGFKMGYIFCEDDAAFPFAAQQFVASTFPEGSFKASLKSSHSPFLSMPERLGEILQQAAEDATKS